MSKQGKGARARAKQRRKRTRKARKEAMQAQYQAWAASGMNRKTKRHVGKGTQFRAVKHAVSYCGNLGCSRCHPEFSDPKRAPVDSMFYGRQWRK